MRLLALAGQRTAALKQYDKCTAALLNELGVPPSAETNALYDQIMAGEVGPPSSTAQAAAANAAQAPFQAPASSGRFLGRDERARLITWLTQPLTGGITAIVGIEGRGQDGPGRRTCPPAAPGVSRRCALGTRRRRRAARHPAKLGTRLRQRLEQDRRRKARAAAMRNILATRHALIVLDSAVAGRHIDLLLPGAAKDGAC